MFGALALVHRTPPSQLQPDIQTPTQTAVGTQKDRRSHPIPSREGKPQNVIHLPLPGCIQGIREGLAMTKKLDNTAPSDPGDFAGAVIKLFRHATESSPEPFDGSVSLEVRLLLDSR
jgi:hypothetical protein